MPSAPLAKRVKRTLRYGLIRAVIALLRPVSWSTARALGARLGSIAFRLASREREKALRSLGRAFPERSEADRVELARACFRHLATAALEVASEASVDQHLDEHVEWPDDARQVLEAALARGKGVLFVTGHVGNWELLARRVARAYPAQSIAKETSDPRLTKLVGDFRARGQVRSIWRGQPGAVKEMLRALKNGEVLGLLIDQDTRAQSVFVPFFGTLAATPHAGSDLALRTGAAVVTGFCQRHGVGYRISMEELTPAPAADREAAALQLTAQLSERIEAAIRRAPEQWVWMHQRWKTRPPDEAPVAALPPGQ